MMTRVIKMVSNARGAFKVADVCGSQRTNEDKRQEEAGGEGLPEVRPGFGQLCRHGHALQVLRSGLAFAALLLQAFRGPGGERSGPRILWFWSGMLGSLQSGVERRGSLPCSTNTRAPRPSWIMGGAPSVPTGWDVTKDRGSPTEELRGPQGQSWSLDWTLPPHRPTVSTARSGAFRDDRDARVLEPSPVPSSSRCDWGGRGCGRGVNRV